MKNLSNPVLIGLFLAGALPVHAVDTPTIPGGTDPGFVLVPLIPREIAPADNAVISFSLLHTRSRNGLQVQLEPVGACQSLVVDSVRVLDTVLAGRAPFLPVLSAPRRDVQVWWRLFQYPIATSCAKVEAALYLVELPNPREAMTDSVIPSWIPGGILAVGPNGRTERADIEVVDQSGGLLPRFCPTYHCYGLCPPDSVARSEFLGMIRQQIANGLPVVRVGRGGNPNRVPISIDDSSLVAGLGPLSKWNAGNLAWKETVPIRSVASWGAAAPRDWSINDGRVFYQWRNGVVCCEGCDTLCEATSESRGISSRGATWSLSNDSTMRWCAGSGVDSTLVQDLSEHDWLILPDSAEVREGRLISTLSRGYCGGRAGAWKIVNDSVEWNCARFSLSDLGQSLGVLKPTSHLDLRVFREAHGWRLETGLAAGERWTATLRDHAGRILSSAGFEGTAGQLAVEAHGLFLLEIRSSKGRAIRTLAM